MFRKIRESVYFKAAMTVILSGAVLIAFHNWVSETRFSVGFETINKTLAPVYIGVIFAFILCPVYNACVKAAYGRMLKGLRQKGFSFGAMIVHDEMKGEEISSEERRSVLNAARTVASLVCVILVVGLAGLLIYFVVPQVVSSAINLANTLPERLTTLSEWLSVHFSHFPMLSKWVDNLANAGTQDIIRWVQEHILNGNAMSIASMISSGVVTAFKYVANVFIGMLIMVYLLNYKERLFAMARKFIAATCGQKRQESLFEFADIVNETFIGFIVGRIIDSFIIGLITGFVLRIFGIPFALMISVIVGVTNIIPFFGPFIGAVPSAFILMLEEPMDAFYFIIIIVIIQQIDGNIIGPKIVGNAIGMGSFWVLLAVLIGGGLFGFPGMALGVPVFAVIYRYADKMTIRSLRHRNKAIHTSDYYSLEALGLDGEDIALESEHRKQPSIFERLRFSKEKLAELGKARKDDPEESEAPGETDETRDKISYEKPVGEPKHKAPKVPSHISDESDDYRNKRRF